MTYLKLPPERPKMKPELEALRSLELRAMAVKRDFGEDNHEYVRLWSHVRTIWNGLSQEDRSAYIRYMSENHSAFMPGFLKKPSRNGASNGMG